MTNAPIPSRADEQRQRVLKAAAEIFSRRGYRGTTMTEIADEVGLRKPSLYHYFRNKEELLVHLYEGVIDEGVSAAREIVASAPTPREALRQLVAHRVSYTCQHRDLLTVFFQEEAQLPPALAESLLVRRREFEDIFISVVDAALGSGRASFQIPVRVYVNACLGAANWVYKWYNPDGALSPEELGGQIAGLMLDALPDAPDDGTPAAGRRLA
ncbi:MAG TPA: TetR/AcrR family transcriptional regulator [Acidimicrobiales bacterium]|jgi:AcrR family transcriptional regulator|nr:TetR/AcrR family transcriptional regulator [Acidimicrobiales bacterium]